jgi:hypothetical protein
MPLLLVFTTILARRIIDAPSPARQAPPAVAALLAVGDSASLFLAGKEGGVMSPLVPHYEAVADPFRATPRAVAQVDRSFRADTPSATVRERVPALSAILITDSRRAAVIDERLVGIGDLLADGARVTAIERNLVIVTASDGSRRLLTLPDAGGV